MFEKALVKDNGVLKMINKEDREFAVRRSTEESCTFDNDSFEDLVFKAMKNKEEYSEIHLQIVRKLHGFPMPYMVQGSTHDGIINLLHNKIATSVKLMDKSKNYVILHKNGCIEFNNSRLVESFLTMID